MADTGYVSNWDFSNKHIDSSIGKDNFMSSARSVIYAAPYQAGANGNVATWHRIGVTQQYNWQENRQVEMIFELGSEIPYLVPGRTVGQIVLTRILVFGKDLVNVLYYEGNPPSGARYIRSLKEINKPIDIMFAAYDNSNQQKVYSRVFTCCWIESRSERVTSGTIIIGEDVSIRYEDCVGVTIPDAD